MKIAFLSRSLVGGGAERQLGLLAHGLLCKGHDVSIFVFYEAPGAPVPAPVHNMGKLGRWDVISFFSRFVRALRRDKPDILHSYLPVANVLALLARPFLDGTRVVIGLRASNMDLARYDRLAALSYRLECFLARGADLIIANSEAVRRWAVARGYPVERIIVIPNGIDINVFRPNPSGRTHLRAAWRIPASAAVLGTVGRLDPMKDHDTFLEAVAQLIHGGAELRAVIVGGGPEIERSRLVARAEALGIADKVVFTGPQQDLTAYYSAMDIFVLSSAFGEGFPNVVGEAMACATPCVVTDVGDAAAIVGETGEVARPCDASSLGTSIGRLLALSPESRLALGTAGRKRIVENYSLGRLIDLTEAALDGLMRTV